MAVLAAPAMGGCAGKLGAPAGEATGRVSAARDSHDASFMCRDAALPSGPMHRLSKLQYTNTVRDLVRATLPTHADVILRDLTRALAALPADAVSKGAPFATMDQGTSQSHIDTYYRVAEGIAKAFTADDARVREVLGCSEGQSDNQCVQSFIERFGRRAFRHPLLDTELTYLRGVYGVNGIQAAPLRDVIMVTLNSPQFLYRVELGDKPVPGKKNAYALSPYEIVTRLAYHFWQTAPDDALLDAAARGELKTEQGYEKLLDRVIADPRTEHSLRAFVAEWLELDGLEPLDKNAGDPKFKAFAGSDMPTPALRSAMIDEVVDSFLFHVHRNDSFADFFASPYSFAKDERLASLYHVPVWDERGDPPRFPEGERAGLLTRAALLATATTTTRPIKKGVFIRERILCDKLGAPPANSANVPPELAKSMTSRQVVETLTQQPRSNCSTCHTSMINPLGFATEGYDALGRKRIAQPLFADDGSTYDSRPVDTTSVPRVWLDDDTPSTGPQDLSSLIVRSGKAEACFARQYIRFTYGRKEQEAVDGCALEAVRSALQEGQSLQQALRAPALRPEFRQRFLGDVQT